MPESSLAELMGREDSSTNMRCWQGTEVQTEDWWGLGSPTRSPERYNSPYGGFEILEKSSSSKPLYHGGHSTLFSCFRQSTVHLTEPDLEPSTPPRIELLMAPCTSMRRGANANVTFMEEASDHHHRSGYEEDLHSDEEPSSPVVNCIGQVRPKKKQNQRKKIELPAAREQKLRRTKSQADPTRAAGPRGAKGKAGKWKQLLQRSSSSSISPSNHAHSDAEGAAAIDLGRFSAATRCCGQP